MTLTENLDSFLSDFGATVVWGAVSSVGVFDMPDQVIGGLAISTEYSVLVKAATFSAVKRGDAITVDGLGYKVKEYKLVDDGKFARISLNST